jgi:hypothetical protein
MSVLIKGMEMPKEGNWRSIRIYPDGTIGRPIGFGDYALVEGAKAVPVPPHGRLGDLDELYASLEKWLIQNRHSMTEATRVWIRGVLEGIAAAPTIIPAEGGET